MYGIISIAHPFQTVEEFQQLVGCRLSELMHRLAGKYPRLLASCGVKRVLLAVSVAWGLSGAAKAGDVDAFTHIDDALQPPVEWGCVKAPPGGCVMVNGEPFFIAEGEQGMLRFLWDGFAIFIDHEGCERVRQEFFDLADLRQSKAYAVMGECNQEYQQQLNNQEIQKEALLENQEEVQKEVQEEALLENQEEVRENQQEIRENRHQTQQSTAKNCSDDNPSLEISSKERISKENYSNDTPYTANCQNRKNSLQYLNSLQCTPPTFKEMLLWGIAYACDIDRVKPEEVETIKDLLEGYLDSPYAEGLTSDDILLISKELRGIKQCRINRLRAREEEAKHASVSPVTNNFYGSIGQWIASVGMVSSEIPKDKRNDCNQKKEQ